MVVLRNVDLFATMTIIAIHILWAIKVSRYITLTKLTNIHLLDVLMFCL